MVFITVSFVITFGLIPRPYLTGFFTVAAKRQTPTSIWDCHYVCTPNTCEKGSMKRSTRNVFLLERSRSDWRPTRLWEVLSVGGASPLGRTPRIYSGLQMPDRPCHTNSPACYSVLASDASSSVSLHWALITKWKDRPTYRNATISAERTAYESYLVN